MRVTGTYPVELPTQPDFWPGIPSGLPVHTFATIAFLFAIGNRCFGRSFVVLERDTARSFGGCLFKRLALERWDQKKVAIMSRT